MSHLRASQLITIAFILVGAIGCGKPQPQLPVEGTYSSALLGSGYVQHFSNKSSQNLTVKVTIVRGDGLSATTLKSGEVNDPSEWLARNRLDGRCNLTARGQNYHDASVI